MAADLSGLILRDPEGDPVPLERLLETDGRSPRWLVVQAIRYYG